MGWNYRVFKTEHENYTEYNIHEVYYESDNDNKPMGYTANPVRPEAIYDEENSTPVADLRWQLKKMLEALDKPILTEKDFNSEEE